MKLLKIDLDFHPPREWMTKWIETRLYILHKLGHLPSQIDIFKTKRGLHIYIKLFNDVTASKANELQFLLGDDHTRVKINAWRIHRHIKHWNKLFAKVLYRRKAKVLTCRYCGNKIPVPDRWFKEEKR